MYSEIPDRLWLPVLLFSGAGSTVLEGNVTVVKPTISSRSKIRMTGSTASYSYNIMIGKAPNVAVQLLFILYSRSHVFTSRPGCSIRSFAVSLDLVGKLLVQCIKAGHDRFFARSFNSLFVHYSVIRYNVPYQPTASLCHK